MKRNGPIRQSADVKERLDKLTAPNLTDLMRVTWTPLTRTGHTGRQGTCHPGQWNIPRFGV
jgi:hypothetical protein